MKLTRHVLVAVLACSLGGCATVRDFCQDQTALCVILGTVIVAGVIVAAQDDDDDSAAPAPVVPSDARLERDIQFAKTLGNGVHLYTLRFWNHDRRFSGVLAQNLLADARSRGAVQVSPEGYYLVDLEAVGLRMTGDAGQYQEAGRRALAEPVQGGLWTRGWPGVPPTSSASIAGGLQRLLGKRPDGELISPAFSVH